jgi:hypothetical protein
MRYVRFFASLVLFALLTLYSFDALSEGAPAPSSPDLSKAQTSGSASRRIVVDEPPTAGLLLLGLLVMAVWYQIGSAKPIIGHPRSNLPRLTSGRISVETGGAPKMKPPFKTQRASSVMPYYAPASS